MAHKVKALQQWCKAQVEGYRDVNVTNMTSSWKSGLAFCAMIHRYRPDLIDYDSLSKENVYENNKLAFEVAKEELDIPDLLEAEDMVAMAVPDKLCIVTYVSQYYNKFRSMTPAGGAGEKRTAIKRPQIESPPSPPPEAKRITPDTIHKQFQGPSQPKRALVGGGGLVTKGSLGDTCHLCHKKVYLMERHLEGGKLYHRHCFRESQKSTSRAFRSARSMDEVGKENTAPSYNTNTTTSNGSTSNGSVTSAKSMAKMWDTKIAEEKRAPSTVQPSSSSSSPSSSGISTPRPLSPRTARVNTQSSPTITSPAAAARETLPESAAQQQPVSPPLWSPREPDKPRSPQPWSPTSTTDTPSPRPRFNLRDSSPTYTPPSPGASASAPLSPVAHGLFPHFTGDSQTRTIPSAPVEKMDVDNDECASNTVNQPPQRSWVSPTSPSSVESRNGHGFGAEDRARPQTSQPKTSRPESQSSVETVSSRTSASPSSPLSPDDGGGASIKLGLLRSLANIRTRSDFKRSSEVGPFSPPPFAAAAGSDSEVEPQKPFIATKANETSPRSILKSGPDGSDTNRDTISNGPKPILKHKEPMTPVRTTAEASDGRPLRSILKSSLDAESGTSSQETSPRSILKHHDDGEDDHKSTSHSILKSVDLASNNDTLGDPVTSAVPRSILKTKDTTNAFDTNSITSEDNTKPFRSILKTRKSSADSLLGSSGDELSSEEMTPRPILKTPPRVEAQVSPTAEPKSILKSKTLSQGTARTDNVVRDSPKPILKSRETSPAPVASPLHVAEPTKPILKKGIHTPTPMFTDKPEPVTSPSGPSVLRAEKSDGLPHLSSSFAAFRKSTTTKSYHSSSHGLEGDTPVSPTEVELELDKPVNNMNAFNIEDSIAVAKLNMAERERKEQKQTIKGTFTPEVSVAERYDPKLSSGTTVQMRKKGTILPPPQENKPEWMVEAEKRQAARAGNFKDPEKAYIKPNKKEEPNTKNISDLTKPARPNTSPGVRPVPKPRSSCTLPGKNKVEGPKIHSNGVSSTMAGANRFGTRKTMSPETTPMDVDDRPQWQIEAEKRQAARKGNYPDPEKVPNKPSNMSKVTQDRLGGPSYGGLAASSKPMDKVKNIDSASRGRVTPRDRSNRLETTATRPHSTMPPPKPLRSPLPTRATMYETDAHSNPNQPGPKPARPTSGPSIATDSGRKLSPRSQELSDLQKRKKSPAPPRPKNSPALTLTRKTPVNPDTSFESRGFNVKKEREYAEIGPPTRPPRALPADGPGKMANRPLPPVPASQSEDSPPKRRVNAEARISQITIIQRLDDLDTNLQELEKEGRVLEEKIRSESDEAMDEAELMVQWFELVNQKNDLVRLETDLMYRQRQQELEDQHEELEYELRCLMEKPDTEKTSSERVREEALLKNLIETVSLRNNIVDSIEEDRIRYLEEDQEIAEMMASKVYNYGFCGKNEDVLSKNNIVKSPKRKTSKDKKKEEKRKSKGRVGIKSCVKVKET